MLIGIGGISNAGKSKLALKIKQEIKTHKAQIISQDDYYYNEAEIPKIKNQLNWEIPESINFKDFKKDIIFHKKNTDLITICEGLMIFYNPEIAELFDKKFFIQISKEEFFKRKKNDLRWGTKPDWYNQLIWDCYLKYGQVNNKEYYFVDGSKEFDWDEIKEFIFQ